MIIDFGNNTIIIGFPQLIKWEYSDSVVVVPVYVSYASATVESRSTTTALATKRTKGRIGARSTVTAIATRRVTGTLDSLGNDYEYA